MADDPIQIDDDQLIRQIRNREEVGLVRLLEMLGPKAKGYLVKHYGDTLNGIDIDAALTEAAARVWCHAESFDPSRGSLKAWFMRIVQRQALDFIEDRKKHLGVDFDLDKYPHVEGVADRDPPVGKENGRLNDLNFVIENKLQGLQKAIIKADLKSRDVASAEWLAGVHGTSTNSIYASRTKARQNIKRYMCELERRRESEGDNR